MKTALPGYRIGIDVGGTFTELVLVRPDSSLHVDKTPTTPEDQSVGVMNGLERLAHHEGLSLRALLGATERIVHGTTTADNTMIQMSGARTGLITSDGHRDEIELRRGFKENIWDPALPPPTAIAPRRQRYGVPERLDFEGNVVVPLDEEAVRQALRRMRKQKIESLAVVLLFSYVDPAHEQRIREIAREELPRVHVSLSHEVLPKAPEFERTSTTLVNAYVAPRIRRYLGNLEKKLARSGFAHPLLLIQSNGGLMTAGWVAERPVTVLGSGPAGGVMGAVEVAARAGVRDFISVDMGGTSYDVCLVRDGKPEIGSSWNWHHRYLVALPMVNVQSVGAGGGSIAHVIEGALHVGPASAGAIPGPICYRRGGREPTVTDANLVLGYLDPKAFYAGELELDVARAAAGIAKRIQAPLGLRSVEEAAWAIYRIVNSNMSNAIRRVSALRGVDPRGLPLVAFGGNGPVHAGVQAADLGIKEVLIPRSAPAFSALGLLLTDPTVVEMRSLIVPADRVDLSRVEKLLAEMKRNALAAFAAAGFRARDVTARRVAFLCYPGQTFDMKIALDGSGPFRRASLDALVEAFHASHEALHTYAVPDQVPIIRGLAIEATAVVEKPELPRTPASRRDVSVARLGHRQAFFGGRFVATPVYDGPALRARHEIRGPAIVQEPLTTIVVHPGQRLVLDARGNFHLHQ